MDVSAWLRSLGFEQYEATFRDNAIDADLLPELTDDDLEKLGLPLGHRKRLLKAITNLSTTDQGHGLLGPQYVDTGRPLRPFADRRIRDISTLIGLRPGRDRRRPRSPTAPTCI